MADIVKELIESGVHFGHRASRWNPKMAPYIYARKNQVHILDIRETVRGLLRAKKYLKQVSEGGSLILFVGTKRQASGIVEREALRSGMSFITERWLGGTLTNFRTIRDRLTRLEELEALRGSDEINSYSKKMQSSLNREYRKMYRNLNGIRSMNRLPECVVVVDPNKERNAIREATKMGIATIALTDTDCDPDIVDLPIPGNDDGLRSIEAIISHLADAVIEGKTGQPVDREAVIAARVAAQIAAAEEAAALAAAAVPIVVTEAVPAEEATAEEATAEEATAEEATAEEAPAEEATAEEATAEEATAEEAPAEEATAEEATAEEAPAEEAPAEEATAEEATAEEAPAEEAPAEEAPAEEAPAEEATAEEATAEEATAEEDK
jgi:small subunit ribosomal protein S2